MLAWADRFLDEIGYFNELLRSEKNRESAEGRIRNLKELMAKATPLRSEATTHSAYSISLRQ
jgi:superfamily I DNA/RNA helicase